MKKLENYVIVVVLLGCSFIQKSCKNSFPNSASDTTPPVFTQVLVRLEAPTPPNPRGEFDISTQDVNKSQLDSDLTIRLIALAADEESGITSIVVESNLTWQCSDGHNSSIIGIVENKPLAFSSITQPSTAVTPVQINAFVMPVAQMGCSIGPNGKGPVNIRGFVRVIATNGKGLKTISKTFIFDYKDIGSL
jgi:hypothetical protein